MFTVIDSQRVAEEGTLTSRFEDLMDQQCGVIGSHSFEELRRIMDAALVEALAGRKPRVSVPISRETKVRILADSIIDIPEQLVPVVVDTSVEEETVALSYVGQDDLVLAETVSADSSDEIVGESYANQDDLVLVKAVSVDLAVQVVEKIHACQDDLVLTEKVQTGLPVKVMKEFHAGQDDLVLTESALTGLPVADGLPFRGVVPIRATAVDNSVVFASAKDREILARVSQKPRLVYGSFGVDEVSIFAQERNISVESLPDLIEIVPDEIESLIADCVEERSTTPVLFEPVFDVGSTAEYVRANVEFWHSVNEKAYYPDATPEESAVRLRASMLESNRSVLYNTELVNSVTMTTSGGGGGGVSKNDRGFKDDYNQLDKLRSWNERRAVSTVCVPENMVVQSKGRNLPAVIDWSEDIDPVDFNLELTDDMLDVISGCWRQFSSVMERDSPGVFNTASDVVDEMTGFVRQSSQTLRDDATIVGIDQVVYDVGERFVDMVDQRVFRVDEVVSN